MSHLEMPLTYCINLVFLLFQKGTGTITQPNYCLTAEAQRALRKSLSVCPDEFSGQTESFQSCWRISWPKATEFLENWYLPILQNLPSPL